MVGIIIITIIITESWREREELSFMVETPTSLVFFSVHTEEKNTWPLRANEKSY